MIEIESTTGTTRINEASMGTNKLPPSFEKLRGRDNYDEWKIAAKAHLVIKEVWTVIEDDLSPDSAPKTNAKCISEITLLVEPGLYNYIIDSKSAKAVWSSLEKAFDDSGTARKVSILNQLVSIKLKNHKNLEKYVNEILLYWQKSKVAGFQIEKQVIASLMQGGLPDEYRAMILGIENSGKELTVDYVKTILLQGILELGLERNDEHAFAATRNKQKHFNKGSKFVPDKRQKKRRCFKCGSEYHILAICPQKNLKCFECFDIRHLVRNCPKKKTTALVALLNRSENDNDHMTNSWFIDSGATAHMSNNKELFENIEVVPDEDIIIANNERIKIEGKGDIILKLNVDNRIEKVLIKNVIYVPDICTNLISVKQLTNEGYSVHFTKRLCRIKNCGGQTVAVAKADKRMYNLCVNNEVERAYLTRTSKDKRSEDNGYLWHRKMGHIGYGNLTFLKNEIRNVTFPKDKCVTCLKARQTRLPFKQSSRETNEVLELVHTDICGPLPVKSIGGSKYFYDYNG